MRIDLVLSLPRDEATLPLTRHIARHCMYEIGVDAGSMSDVALAVTEACANVVQHSRADDEYEVRLTIDDEICEIRVVDTGHGFDHETHDDPVVDATSESGRGITLMRALVDQVNFESQPEEGTIVHLVKRLELDPDGPAARLRSAGDS